MNDDSILGSALGQLGQLGKQTAKQIVKMPAASAEDSSPLRQSSSEASEPKEEKKQQWSSDDERIKYLRDLYGSAKQTLSAESPEKSASFAKASTAKPEDQKKLIELRNQLHKENYYDPTFNPVKKQEERPAEKVEKEKKVEMQELQQKEAKKPPPLAVVREQNKAEMFRGASG